MTQSIKDDRWTDAVALRRSLVGGGWKTPNTYDNCFSEPIDGAAVYLFLLHGWDMQDGFHNFDRSLVAYVGMSKRLSQRWSGHPVLRDIEATGRYVQRWFFPTDACDLRVHESELIRTYDPPWNIQGRKRGLSV